MHPQLHLHRQCINLPKTSYTILLWCLWGKREEKIMSEFWGQYVRGLRWCSVLVVSCLPEFNYVSCLNAIRLTFYGGKVHSIPTISSYSYVFRFGSRIDSAEFKGQGQWVQSESIRGRIEWRHKHVLYILIIYKNTNV